MSLSAEPHNYTEENRKLMVKFQEESSKSIRALQILGFSFPPDMKRTEEQILQLPVEHMLLFRRVYKEQFESFTRMFEGLHDRIVMYECHICEREAWSYEDLPLDWGWCDGQVRWYLMCDECQFRYVERFNKEPVIVRNLEEMVGKDETN